MNNIKKCNVAMNSSKNRLNSNKNKLNNKKTTFFNQYQVQSLSSWMLEFSNSWLIHIQVSNQPLSQKKKKKRKKKKEKEKKEKKKKEERER